MKVCLKNIHYILLRVFFCALFAGCKCDPQDSGFGTFDLPQGFLVYQRTDGIYIKTLGKEDERCLAAGGIWPRFSPDGEDVAFLRDNMLMLVSVKDGREKEVVRIGEGKALAFQEDGNQLVFTDDGVIKSVDLRTRNVRTLLNDYDARELDVNVDGKRLVATVKAVIGYRVMAFDMPKGTALTLGPGCSASLSPDGNTVLVNDGSHKVLRLMPWKGGEPIREIEAPSGTKMDNQFWSNSARWVVAVLEGENQNICILDVGLGTYRKVTETGDCDRPDLFVSKR